MRRWARSTKAGRGPSLAGAVSHSLARSVGRSLPITSLLPLSAGLLALPAATAPAGFLPSSAGLVLAWAYMVASGLLITELSLNRLVETRRPGSGLLELYGSSLGKELRGSGGRDVLLLALRRNDGILRSGLVKPGFDDGVCIQSHGGGGG